MIDIFFDTISSSFPLYPSTRTRSRTRTKMNVHDKNKSKMDEENTEDLVSALISETQKKMKLKK